MRQTVLSICGGTLMVLCLLLCSCTGTPVVPSEDAVQSDSSFRCEPVLDEFEKVHIDAEAAFENAFTKIGAGGNYDRVRELKTSFDSLQNDYQLLNNNLCKDFEAKRIDADTYSRHRFCMDRALLAMRAVQQTLSVTPENPDPQHMAWLLDTKLDWLRENLACNDRAVSEPEKFLVGTRGGVVSNPDAPVVLQPVNGCTTTNSGVIGGGSLTLVPQGSQSLQTCQSVALQATLLCQRQTSPGQYVEVPNCNGSSLREGDRFKVDFRTNIDASVYFFLYNSTGQFQMFFPDKNTPNQTQSNTSYQLPPGDNWIALDNVSNVMEHLQIVASTYPLKELEEQRGANIPPTPKGTPQKTVRKMRGRIEPLATRGRIEPLATRGRIEPLATRGGIYNGGTLVLEASTPGKTAPAAGALPPVKINATGQDVAVVEFIIRHTP